jgi:putative restriction endonuclease
MSGREAVLNAMDSARSLGMVQENVEYAYLDDKLHWYLLNAETRAQLRQILITRWFGKYAGALVPLQAEDRYERDLRAKVWGSVAEEPAEEYELTARDTAFRRVVTDAYDYRCAATGLRLVLPGDLVMVQAAHLIPFSEAQDDDPRNGIALTPDFHWAMDRGIIAPGPDLMWHVSKIVDERIADNKVMVALKGQGLILPKEKRFWPREDALNRRLRMLKE